MSEHVFDRLERIRADLAAVREEALAGLPTCVQSTSVRELAALRDRVDAELIRSVGQWDVEGCWADDGAASPAAWLTEHAGLRRGDARRLLRTARLVREHDATADALANGEISATAVGTIAAVTRHREDLYAQSEAGLLRMAASLSAEEFRAVGGTGVRWPTTR